MEEILSSIRRIIADDEEDGAPTKKSPAATGPEPDTKPEEQASEEEDVLDLTQVVANGTDASEAKVPEEDADEIELAPDEEVEAEPAEVAPQPVTEPVRAATERSMSDDDSLVSAAAASASTGAFAKLTKAALSSDAAPLTGGDKTVEAFLFEMLRPMLKEWLDANLETVVERVVEQEVKKLARRAELM